MCGRFVLPAVAHRLTRKCCQYERAIQNSRTWQRKRNYLISILLPADMKVPYPAYGRLCSANVRGTVDSTYTILRVEVLESIGISPADSKSDLAKKSDYRAGSSSVNASLKSRKNLFQINPKLLVEILTNRPNRDVINPNVYKAPQAVDTMLHRSTGIPDFDSF